MRRASNGNPHADAGADRRFGERLIPPMWDINLVQLVKEDAMLSNYDAKAVAEVLGLVLLRA